MLAFNRFLNYGTDVHEIRCLCIVCPRGEKRADLIPEIYVATNELFADRVAGNSIYKKNIGLNNFVKGVLTISLSKCIAALMYFLYYGKV